MWEIKINDGKCEIQFLSTLSRHSRSVNACRFSPDGNYYIVNIINRNVGIVGL